ncbi:GNAT family N-acetyltransferase [Pelistega europaea]|uniref:GNAT family N-acetyltransferase n=1 Tax=Pelistega europaea TaxID=106147 RepID=A0A7Y4LCC8_9BURK|nr:GNAT family N-acetyltransferase [Pelistega europaea]
MNQQMWSIRPAKAEDVPHIVALQLLCYGESFHEDAQAFLNKITQKDNLCWVVESNQGGVPYETSAKMPKVSKSQVHNIQYPDQLYRQQRQTSKQTEQQTKVLISEQMGQQTNMLISEQMGQQTNVLISEQMGQQTNVLIHVKDNQQHLYLDDNKFKEDTPGSLLAYMMCARATMQYFPCLNMLDYQQPIDGDTLYLHDMAIAPQARGLGLKHQLLTRVLQQAQQLSLKQALLVAVQGAAPVWRKQGFEVVDAQKLGLADVLASYGDDAVLMYRKLAV